LISIENIRDFVQNENYEYYNHAITEAKKDGVEPEDVVCCLPARLSRGIQKDTGFWSMGQC